MGTCVDEPGLDQKCECFDGVSRCVVSLGHRGLIHTRTSNATPMFCSALVSFASLRHLVLSFGQRKMSTPRLKL